MNRNTQKVNQLIPYEYTDKKISPWGGMRLVKQVYDRTSLPNKLRTLPFHEVGSSIGYDHFEIIESFMVSVILGAGNTMGASQISYDEVLKEIFQWKKGMPSQSSLSRFFQKYSQGESDNIFSILLNWWFDALDYKNLTLDIDSTVITRYGNQEGAKAGYNPRKKGRKSHHPIMAFLAELKMVANAWMRTGDSTSSTEFKEFLDNTFTMIGQERIGLVRGDSGFSGNEILNDLEYRYSAYVTNTKMSDELVWITYKHRAEAENQIKELKYDYALEGFCFNSMEATEFAFRWVLMAYNFMSYFKNAIAVSKVKHSLSTLKFKCIAIGSYLVTSGSKKEYIDSLFQKIDNLNTFSTA
jgi:hypothetical protein